MLQYTNRTRRDTMIRKATKTDAKAISPLLYNALHEIAEKSLVAQLKQMYY